MRDGGREAEAEEEEEAEGRGADRGGLPGGCSRTCVQGRPGGRLFGAGTP